MSGYPDSNPDFKRFFLKDTFSGYLANRQSGNHVPGNDYLTARLSYPEKKIILVFLGFNLRKKIFFRYERKLKYKKTYLSGRIKMRHLVLSLLVLGFSENLQAKLEVSSSSGKKNKDQIRCADRAKASHTEDVQQSAPVIQTQDNKEVQRSVSGIDKPSSESVSSHNDKDSQKESIVSSQSETTFQKNNPTVSVDDQKKQSERTLARVSDKQILAQASDRQILSEARFCIANFTRISEQFSVICNGRHLSGLKARGIKTISKVGHYLVGVGFIPINCWSSGSQELSKLHIYCAYYKSQ